MPHDEDTLARARSFEVGAETYDQFRPGYPGELFDDVLGYASDRVDSRVLDVGAGTGKATIELARLGRRVTAVEPASTMAQVLRTRAEEAGVGDRVEVRVATFEDLGAADGGFDLLVAAQSFHWTDPATRWRRMVELLVPSGAAALFWNNWHLEPAVHDLDQVRSAYARVAPSLVADLPVGEPGPWPVDEIRATDGLADLRHHTYDWRWEMPTSDYLTLLSTTSQYAVAPQQVREGLFGRLEAILGQRVHLTVTTQLHLMRRAPATAHGTVGSGAATAARGDAGPAASGLQSL